MSDSRNETSPAVFNPPMTTGRQPVFGTVRLVRRSRRLAGLAGLALLAGVAFGANAWAAAPAAPDSAPEPATATPAEATPAEAAPQPPIPVKPANPYLAVVARNAFGLKDPPPPKSPEPEPEPEPEIEPSALKLSAISTLLSANHAMFVLEEKGQKRVYSGLVAEGDTDSYIAGLEVLSINPVAGSVQVRFGGKELLLDFKNNGLEPPKATAAARPGGGNPRVAGVGRGAVPRGGSPTNPGQTTAPGGRAGNTTWTAPGISRGAGSRTPTVVPSRNVRSTSVNPNDGPVLSPAQQVLIMRAQAQAARNEGIDMPPSPPIPGLDFQPGAEDMAPEAPPGPGE